ncbi:hypothetical protein BN1221_04920c [Brenneria goodwinii]|uniref:Uncharacterized protein n=1 Tax=Brenneria goodwinii TaxID=1109412 RepID=A0A0G4K2I9_9GAMM|nr:hypothetical protein BN1221_04920c [Brenneria goodwinii]
MGWGENRKVCHQTFIIFIVLFLSAAVAVPAMSVAGALNVKGLPRQPYRC